MRRSKGWMRGGIKRDLLKNGMIEKNRRGNKGEKKKKI
jgi:hypothetical protein